MAGGYEPEQYQRDVVRMRIIRSQQLHQIQVGIVILIYIKYKKMLKRMTLTL